MAFDIIGDIAIVEPGVDGKKFLKEHNSINVVLSKKGDVEGEFRIRDYEILATREGRDFSDIPAMQRPRKITQTIHKENGCRFKVDPTEAYFSVRLGTERQRIAKLVKRGEKVLVMFAGVGPYPITIANLAEPELVVGIELNPYAVLFFEDNIVLNKMQGKVQGIEGDVRDIVPKLKEEFDRVVMPLPKESENYLYLALKRIKKGGQIHLYKILHENEVDAFVSELKKSISRAKIEVVKAGNYAPGSFRYCFDITLDVTKPRKRDIIKKKLNILNK
jgi:tRNA (guanine37-N1)-methyltransferase